MAKPIRHRGKWRIRWVDETGRRHSEVYREYRDAVRKLTEHQHHVEQVRRGLRSPDPPPKLFGDLCDYWVAHRVPQKRSGGHDESIIRCHLRPAFGTCRLLDVGVERVDHFVAARAHLDRKTINNHLTLLIAMLNVAVDLGWLLKVPRIKKPRIRLINSDYRYLRTDDEIQRFLRAAYDEGEHVYTLYATAIYTGMRAGELAGLLWADVDFPRRLITVQRSYEGPTKAEDVRYVPILDPLLPILREWRLRHPGRLVFSNQDGRMIGRSGRVFQEVLHRILESAGFPPVERKGKLARYIVFHDLRHTFASHWVMREGDLNKLRVILGHKSYQMTHRYRTLPRTSRARSLSTSMSTAAKEPFILSLVTAKSKFGTSRTNWTPPDRTVRVTREMLRSTLSELLNAFVKLATAARPNIGRHSCFLA